MPRRTTGHRLTSLLLALAAVGALLAAAGTRSAGALASGGTLVVAAGDIARAPDDPNYYGGTGTAQACAQGATARTVTGLAPAAVLVLGDEQYPCGTSSQFAGYSASWGRLLPITHAVPGNHEYGLDQPCAPSNASGYFGFFGSHAGSNPRGWYSFDLGGWHVVALNSECHAGSGSAAVEGCQRGSPQETWLRNDLAAHPSRCTLAFWHESRFTTSVPGEQQQTADLWNDLASAKADVVLSGHDHVYERFAPAGVTPRGTPGQFQPPVTAADGIREFVVGTGGRSLGAFTVAQPPSEAVRQNRTFGVLALTLGTGDYSWRFVDSRGPAFADAGTGSCH